ncbi:MAG: trigger factor [Bryobacteraceae bacterium]
MALVEGCKHEVEITVPVEDIRKETDRIVSNLQQKAKLPGFRPGKAPASLIRSKFGSEIRQEVLESLVPKAFRSKADEENLRIVGTPNVVDIHYHEGEPLRFKAEFEVAPEFELKEYRELPAPYAEPAVMDQEITDRIETIRKQKAEFVNEDPRPIQDGDYAVVSLRSVSGVEGEPIESDEMVLHIGDEETLPEFTEHLRGVSPGEEKELAVAYPADYGQERLAGKNVVFHVAVKAVRRQELPELNDEFARDLGDYQTLEELRDAVRKTLQAEKEYAAQGEAKTKLIDELVNRHEFPVPEAFVERQIETVVEQQLRSVAARGVDPRSLKLDWAKIKEAQRDQAVHDVKASLLLERVADAESIHATTDEVDREVQRVARSEREPVAAVRMRLEKDGALARIAARIRTEKTLNYLFEHARKIAGPAD